MTADRSWIGRTGQPVRMRIEHGKIREFATALKDPDPIYRDEASGVIPPVTFLVSMALWHDGEAWPEMSLDMTRVLHGEHEIEFFAPIHAGDVLTAAIRITDVYEKPGKRGGPMTFIVMETDFTGADGTLVARVRNVRVETGQVVAR